MARLSYALDAQYIAHPGYNQDRGRCWWSRCGCMWTFRDGRQLLVVGC